MKRLSSIYRVIIWQFATIAMMQWLKWLQQRQRNALSKMQRVKHVQSVGQRFSEEWQYIYDQCWHQIEFWESFFFWDLNNIDSRYKNNFHCFIHQSQWPFIVLLCSLHYLWCYMQSHHSVSLIRSQLLPCWHSQFSWILFLFQPLCDRVLVSGQYRWEKLNCPPMFRRFAFHSKAVIVWTRYNAMIRSKCLDIPSGYMLRYRHIPTTCYLISQCIHSTNHSWNIPVHETWFIQSGLH